MIEKIVFIVYLAGMLFIGYYFSRRDETLEDYLLGGRTIGPAVTALTMQSTSMSGYMFMGGPALTFKSGWFGFWYATGDVGGGLVNLAILGKRMRRLSQILGALTPIEYLEKRYECKAITIIGSLISIVFLSCYVIGQFIASGKTLETLTGWPFAVSLLIGVGVIIGYTVSGGYLAVCWTDFFQGIIMVLGMFGILIMGLSRVGGLTGLNNALGKMDPTYLSLWGKGLEYNNQWGVALGALLIYAIGYMGLPHVVVRHMSMKSPKTAKVAAVYSTIWNILFVYSPYVLGLIGIALLPNLKDPEMVVPALAHEVFPGIFSALLLTAIMAAIMSTADSLLMQAGSILARDVYQRFFRPNASQKQMVFVSRLLVFAVGVFGIILAVLQPPTVFGIVVFAFGTLGDSFIVPYIAAVYYEKANKVGALAAMISGAITNIIWTAGALDRTTAIHPFLAGLIVSAVFFVIFNRFGRDPSQEIKDAVRRAMGVRIPKGVESGISAMMAPEAKAVARFLREEGVTA
ncbi:MAG TPA: sodium/proline symporter [Clostridia bacterium]|nr:sodium/proline symporter [Clostridia bacterium]